MNKQEIITWLKKYEITNYHINDDLTVDVDGDVNFFLKRINEIPFQFGIVKGYFGCYGNNLTSLKGCPKEVYGEVFDCSHNQLTSLEGCPKIIKGNLLCHHNKLTSLKYLPDNFGLLLCDDNLKNSIEYKRYLIKRKLKQIS